MKGRVITDRGRGAQVVEITEDDGTQIGVVAFRGEPGLHSIVWADVTAVTAGYHLSIASDVLEAAREALRERYAAFLLVTSDRMRVMLRSTSGVITNTITQPVLSPSGRRISFEFTHRALETGPERYELVLRRKRA